MLHRLDAHVIQTPLSDFQRPLTTPYAEEVFRAYSRTLESQYRLLCFEPPRIGEGVLVSYALTPQRQARGMAGTMELEGAEAPKEPLALRLDRMDRELERLAPHRRLLRSSLFAFALFTLTCVSPFFGVPIVLAPWNWFGLLASFSFILLAYAMEREAGKASPR